MCNNSNMMTNSSGNVLFLILIAVALFAALSYAVTQSTRSGGGDASKEKLLTESSVIVQKSVSIRTAATQMMISRGITAAELLFDPPKNFGGLTAGEIAREVFHPQGGGAIYPEGWIVTSALQIDGIGLTDTGNPLKGSDIVAITSVSREMCDALNKKLGIAIDIALSDANIDLVATNYDDNMDKAHPGINGGVNGYWGSIGSAGTISLPPYTGKPQGCFYNGASDFYIYYDVIIER